MNITEVKKVLPVLMKHKIVPFLWGSQGKGKTQIVKQIAKELNYDSVVHLCLASQDVGDLVGVLLEQPDGTAKHTRPDWFPAKGKHLIFLDELNRAHPDVIQAMFTFILEGKIHTHKLPAECSIVAAGNYQTSSFQTTDISDSAFMSRFCHLDFQPTVEEFTGFADERGAVNVADFIRDHKEMLELKSKEEFNFSSVTPDRRAWLDFIHPLESEYEIENERYEVYKGIVGPTAAAAFSTWKTKAKDGLKGKDILTKYKGAVQDKVQKISMAKDIRFDLLSSATEELMLLIEGKTIKPKELENFKAFLLDIPLEMGLKVFNRLNTLTWAQKNDILNNKEFVSLFKSVKVKK